MSLSALLITALVESLAPEPRMVSCTFPATSPEERTISVAVEARPSLMDVEGRFHVRLHIGDDRDFGGLAQAIDRTDERDVLIRARAADDLIYSIGIRDDGLASLNLLKVRPALAASGQSVTREGACANFTTLLNAWLRS